MDGIQSQSDATVGSTQKHVAPDTASPAADLEQGAQPAVEAPDGDPPTGSDPLPPVNAQLTAMINSLGPTLPVLPSPETPAQDTPTMTQSNGTAAHAPAPSASGVNYDALLASLSSSTAGIKTSSNEQPSTVVPDAESRIPVEQAAVNNAIPFDTDVDQSDTVSQTNAEIDKLVARAESSNYEPAAQAENPQPDLAPASSSVFAHNHAHGLPDKPETADGDDSIDSAEENAAFEQFLKDEREYVSIGNWEQFPHGSRLFIGDIHAERVSKRDVFHVFYKYGKLAQISLKQAYGFVQFITVDECRIALQAEQGRVVKGRKINLEISKPQKNRNDGGRKRSRSPGGRQPHGVDRYTSAEGGRADRHRGGRRERDDYRPSRASPPPSRGHNDRDRDRYGRRRSRSPQYQDHGRVDRYREPLPPRREHADEDDDLPLPRRLPRDVPDVQVIVTGELDRNFISWVERTFMDRGVRVDVLLLSPRMPEAAVIRRQIIEGVLAVSKVDRMSQQIGKIPLQVFDRRGGADVRFEQYADLEPLVAAEVVLRAKASSNIGQAPTAPANGYGYGYGYGAGAGAGAGPGTAVPAAAAAVPTSGAPGAQDLSKLIGSMDSNGLQQLLGAMQQQGQVAPPVLAQAMAAQPAVQSHAGYPQQGYGQASAGQQPDMANILAQLSNYRQR